MAGQSLLPYIRRVMIGMKLNNLFKSKIFGYITICAGIIGIGAQLVLILTFKDYLYGEGSSNPLELSGWNYLSFFTQITNIATAVWLLFFGVCRIAGAEAALRKITHPLLHGGITLSIFVVGFIYWGVLFWFIDLYPWNLWFGNLVDFWNHAFIPLSMTLFWIFYRDERKVDTKKIYLWLIYPIVYFVFSMVRGYFVNWYPYPFLDPNDEMLAGFGVNSYIIIAAAVVVLTGVFYGFGRLTMWIRNRRIKE